VGLEVGVHLGGVLVGHQRISTPLAPTWHTGLGSQVHVLQEFRSRRLSVSPQSRHWLPMCASAAFRNSATQGAVSEVGAWIESRTSSYLS